MALAWNEIKDRALAFSRDWAKAESEDADAKPFWIEFFQVFGINQRRIGSFEQKVKKLGDRDGYIDWLWKGNLLIEHKSRGKDLDRAYQQAIDYFPGLKEHELPRFVLVSDFARFRLYDMIEGTHSEFLLKELYKNVKLFWFIAGYQPQKISPQSPVNAKAVQRMARLHDRLKQIGYTGHALEVYLVRLLFCLFAEDTGIFERTQFTEFIEQQTREDGSDLAPQLAQLFDVLNTPEAARLRNLDDTLADLYDPLAMPPELVRAHQTLDRAVDAAYGKKLFASEAERVAFLFERYQTITSLLLAATTRKPGKKKQQSNPIMTRFLDG